MAGVTMTRDSAINLRKTLLGRSFSNTNFDDALIRKINNDFTKAKMAINKSQENADRQKEAMSTALASSDKKVLSDDSLKAYLPTAIILYTAWWIQLTLKRLLEIYRADRMSLKLILRVL
ncbi:MAG: hypothetical protein ACLTDF_03400 [Coprococcus sp.]